MFLWGSHVPLLKNRDFMMNKEDTGEEISSFFHRGIGHLNSVADSCRCGVLLQHPAWS